MSDSSDPQKRTGMNEDRSRQRLGRGLAALIGTGSGASPARGLPAGGFGSPEPGSGGERKVELGRISPNPRNPRRRFGEAELAELTASVKVHGVVQPILVRPRPGGGAAGGDYEIVAGERRWRAAQAAGLAEMPVIVREIGDREAIEIAIIENVQRADLNAVEEAEAYRMLIAEHGYSQADLADALGKSRSHVANTLRLLKLPDAVQGMLVRGELSPGHARTAVSAADPEAFAREIVRRGLSVREAEDLAREAADGPAAAGPESAPPAPRKPGKPRQPAPPPEPAGRRTDADTEALERLLSQALGMPVAIRLPDEGGDIRIGYGSLEALHELCRLLQARGGDGAAAAGPRIRSL